MPGHLSRATWRTGQRVCDPYLVALPELQPMLASSGRIAAPEHEWAFEPKLDGWRALVCLDDEIKICTRSGRDVTSALPELAPLADSLSQRSLILDGELVAGGGRSFDFYRLAPRLSAGISTQRGRRRTPCQWHPNPGPLSAGGFYTSSQHPAMRRVWRWDDADGSGSWESRTSTGG